MENREIFSTITSLPPVFVRLDGRAFHRLADCLGLEKPFDEFFHKAMVIASTTLVTDSGLNPDFAYTFSDEISLYFSKLPFSGRVEKIDSVAASYAASSFTLALGGTTLAAFDARVIPATPAWAVEYMANRQAEAWRNHINGYAQAVLVADGLSPRQAAARLRGLASPALHDLAFARGVNLGETPAWQRRGILVYRRAVEVEGRDPRTGAVARAVRSRAAVDRDLPLFSSDEGRALLAGLIPGL